MGLCERTQQRYEIVSSLGTFQQILLSVSDIMLDIMMFLTKSWWWWTLTYYQVPPAKMLIKGSMICNTIEFSSGLLTANLTVLHTIYSSGTVIYIVTCAFWCPAHTKPSELKTAQSLYNFSNILCKMIIKKFLLCLFLPLPPAPCAFIPGILWILPK